MKEVGFLGRMYDEFLWFFTRAFHGSPQNYCDIESAEPPWMLVAKNGGLGGSLRINGVRQLQDETSFLEMIGKIAQDLGPALSHKGHVIQVCWYRNSENIINSLEKALRPSRETTKRLELDLGDIIDEEARVLSEYTADEQVYMVLWTMPEVLPIKLRREAQEEMKSLTAENLPGGKDGGFGEGQKFLRSISQLRDRHLAFVFALRQAFDAAGIDIEEVGAHEILREARAALYPYCTDESWRPRLPGDRIPRRIVERENLEPGDLLYQKISEQLIPFDGVRLPGELIKIGERIWAPIVVSLGPVNPMPFNRLLGRIVETGDIPFRMSFLIEGDGIDVLKYKVQLARLLSWDPVSANNRNLIAVKEALSELRDRQNEQIAKLRITAATWADTETEARRRKALLVRAIQSWGSCDTEACGDPLGALLSAIPAFRVDSPAPAMAPPIPDLIAILPITRPASPWKAAPKLLRSVDGKLFPYDMRSSRQTAHVTLGNAPMRAGKSVFSNKALLDFILHPMNEQLPRVGIIDVGASSSGLISLLKGALGRRAYLAEFFRLVMDPRRYAVNPFDTPLGSRYPTQLQMGFLQNLLLLLLTPLDQDAPPKGMEGLVQHAIEFIYRHFGSEKPKLYNRGQNQYLDEMIEKMSIRVDSKTSWWNIVDQFFERAQTSDNESMTHAAMLAQRYAMPL